MANSSVHWWIKWLIPCFEEQLIQQYWGIFCLQASNKWLPSLEIRTHQLTPQWWQSFCVIQRAEDTKLHSTIQNKYLEKETQLKLPTTVQTNYVHIKRWFSQWKSNSSVLLSEVRTFSLRKNPFYSSP